MSTIVQPQAAEAARSGRLYCGYVLFLLFLTNAFNFADRILIGVLQEPLRHEFKLSDFELGLLGGPAFALLYSVLGIPIARLAERRNRAMIVSAAIAIWSGMTAVCGLATSYAQLFLGRVGVSIGEAGCAPPAHSLIADYFPRLARGRAMAIYATGAPLGSLAATMLAGLIASQHGWRTVFLVYGLAGLVMAALVGLTLREPRRGDGHAASVGSFLEAARVLFAKRGFRYVCLGAAVAGMASNFIVQYLVSFLMRAHGLPLSQAATIVGLGLGVGGGIATFASGAVADRWAKRNDRALALVPAVAFCVATALYLPAFLVSGLGVAVALLVIAPFFQNCFMGQSFAMVQSVAPNRMRATASALFIVANSVIGFGLGPPLLGALSDALAQAAPVACDPASSAIAACTLAAKAFGLRWALVAASLLFLAAAGLYWAASRTLAVDYED